jgi:hypothetical protein
MRTPCGPGRTGVRRSNAGIKTRPSRRAGATKTIIGKLKMHVGNWLLVIGGRT